MLVRVQQTSLSSYTPPPHVPSHAPAHPPVCPIPIVCPLVTASASTMDEYDWLRFPITSNQITEM